MHRWYAGVAYAVVAFGLVHITAATRMFDGLSTAALWFVSGGLIMILTGILNLLNRVYGQRAPGLRMVCVANNVFMTLFTAASGLVSNASVMALVSVIGLFTGVTVMSLLPRSFRAQAAP